MVRSASRFPRGPGEGLGDVGNAHGAGGAEPGRRGSRTRAVGRRPNAGDEPVNPRSDRPSEALTIRSAGILTLSRHSDISAHRARREIGDTIQRGVTAIHIHMNIYELPGEDASMAIHATVRRLDHRLKWPITLATVWFVVYGSLVVLEMTADGRSIIEFLLSPRHLTDPSGWVFFLSVPFVALGVAFKSYLKLYG